MSLPNISNLTTQQLIDLNHEVVALIKARRTADSQRARRALSVGDTVEFKDNYGITVSGRVEKVMRTRGIVNVDGRRWKCHLNLLTRVA